MDEDTHKQLEAFLEQDRQRKMKQSLRVKRWIEAHPELHKERAKQYKQKYTEQKRALKI